MNYIPESGGMDSAMAGAAVVVMIIYFVIVLGACAFSIAAYILSSLGLSTVAERRGIRNSWLAWIPFGNMWIIGSLSDQYQYLVKGKIKNRRKKLLALNIAMVVLYVVILFSAIISTILTGEPSVLIFIAAVGFFVAAVAMAVLQYMCYYDFFRSCDKSNGVLYLVLSIVVSVVMPFLVFACRKKDEGMPPRKQPETPAEPEVPAEPVQVEVPAPVEEVPTEEIPVVETPVEEELPVEEPPVKPEETIEE